MKRFIPLVCLVMLLTPRLLASDFVPVAGKTNWGMKVSFRYQEVSIRRFLLELGNTFHFTFLLDRRVDPDLTLSADYSLCPLVDALADSLESAGLSWCIVRSHLYVGPPNAAGKLLLAVALLNDKLESPAPVHSHMTKMSPFAGKQFGQPRDMLNELAQEAGYQWTGLDRMPFDCWNAFFMSPLSIAEQIQMILIGFNVRFEFDSESNILRPIAMDDGTKIAREYKENIISDEIRNRCSECRFDQRRTSRQSSRIRVSGSFSAMAQLESLVAQADIRQKIGPLPTSSTQGDLTKKTKQGRTEATGMIEHKKLKDVFDTFGPVFDITMALDESFEKKGITLETRISCKFDRAGLKKVLDTIAAELNARYQKNQKQIIFYPVN